MTDICAFEDLKISLELGRKETRDKSFNVDTKAGIYLMIQRMLQRFQNLRSCSVVLKFSAKHHFPISVFARYFIFKSNVKSVCVHASNLLDLLYLVLTDISRQYYYRHYYECNPQMYSYA